MKTTLTAALSIILAISATAETNQEALDAAYEWVEQESFRQESRAAQARQQAALDDLRWELAQQRRQAQANARAQEAAARRQREQQWADREQRRFVEANQERRAR